MYRVLSCLRDQHDYRLVLLAVLICALATYTAFHIYASVRQSQGSKRLGWIFLTGIATGAGIWATHFVAMLAFKTGLPTAYDPVLTLASLLIAIGVTATGFLIAAQGEGRWQPALGGVVIGAGIASMHYTGMRAFTTTGTVEWDSTLVAASVVLGAAALVRFHGDSPLSRYECGRAANDCDLHPAFHRDGRGDHHARPHDRRLPLLPGQFDDGACCGGRRVAGNFRRLGGSSDRWRVGA